MIMVKITILLYGAYICNSNVYYQDLWNIKHYAQYFKFIAGYLLHTFRTNSSIIFLWKEEMEGYFTCVFAMIPNIINDRENIISDTFAQEDYE